MRRALSQGLSISINPRLGRVDVQLGQQIFKPYDHAVAQFGRGVVYAFAAHAATRAHQQLQAHKIFFNFQPHNVGAAAFLMLLLHGREDVGGNMQPEEAVGLLMKDQGFDSEIVVALSQIPAVALQKAIATADEASKKSADAAAPSNQAAQDKPADTAADSAPAK